MELMMKNGDYIPDGRGGFCRATGSDALLQRVLFTLTVRRGSFPFLPELGSDLHLLHRAKPSERALLARQYVTRALAGEPDLSVTDVTLTPLEGGEGDLQVDLIWRGDPLSLTLGVTTG